MVRLINLALLLVACGPDPLRYHEPEENPPTQIVTEGTIVCELSTAVLPVIDDTFLFEQYPDSPQGTRTEVFYSWQPGARAYPLVRFDAAEIPDGELKGARFHFTTVNVGKHLDSGLLGGIALWDDTSTWRDMEEAPLPWVEEIGATSTTTNTGRSTLELPLAWVEGWRSGAHANNGFLLRTDATVGFNTFASSESLDPPTIAIDYIACRVEE